MEEEGKRKDSSSTSFFSERNSINRNFCLPNSQQFTLKYTLRATDQGHQPMFWLCPPQEHLSERMLRKRAGGMTYSGGAPNPEILGPRKSTHPSQTRGGGRSGVDKGYGTLRLCKGGGGVGSGGRGVPQPPPTASGQPQVPSNSAPLRGPRGRLWKNAMVWFGFKQNMWKAYVITCVINPRHKHRSKCHIQI